MSRADRANALVLAVALALGALATTVGSPRRSRRREGAPQVAGHVVDASGTPVKVADYRRVVAGSLVAHPDPDVVVLLADGVGLGHGLGGDALAGAERRDVGAGAGGLELPAVVRALDAAGADLAAGELHVAVRAAIAQRGRAPVRAAEEHDGLAEDPAGQGLGAERGAVAGDVPVVAHVLLFYPRAW